MRTNIIDKPSTQSHKKHRLPIPLLGGFAMCTTWCLVIMAGLAAPSTLPLKHLPATIVNCLSGLFQMTPRLLAIVAGGIFITILGFVDDKYNMSAKLKFLGQLVIVSFVIYYGDITISLFIHSNIINWIITIFWMLLIINAINFFDNMDGLAVGISTIAFFFFTITAIIFQHYFIASLGAVTIGTALGFWFYNHSPATIFMGDSGSHFLGYTLGIAGVITTYYQQGITNTCLSVLIPVFILAIPIFDLISVVIIRLHAGKPVYIGDNNHISHRFCRLGLQRKTSVLCIHLLAIIISLSVLPLLWGNIQTAIVCLIQACVLLILISIIQFAGKK